MFERYFKAVSAGCAGLALAAAATAPAAVVAGFTDGNGTASADQFLGTAGGGWAGGWGQAAKLVSTTMNAGVTNTSPVAPGAGNYLNIDYRSGSSAANDKIWRMYSSDVASGGIGSTATHTISFQFRLDSDRTNYTASGDFIRLYAGTNTNGLGASTSWAIVSSGNTLGGSFRVMEGNGAGGQTTTDTEIMPTTGAVYSVSLLINPTTSRWDVTLSDGVKTFTRSGMRFYNNGTSAGRVLMYETQVTNNGERMAYSLDNLSISVPEPASLSVLSLGGLSLLARRSGTRK